jgi:ABC-type branched-subunit amino acid transport system substrate-binding protein
MYKAVGSEQACRRAEGQRRRTLLFPSAPLLPCISFFLILLTGCQRVAPVLKIALVGPFEGAHRAIGYDVIYAARLAVREINQEGGIGGYRISLVSLDDSGDPELARAVAESQVIDPAVVAVVGHWLPETTAAAKPIYASAGLPFLATGEPPLGQFDPGLLPAHFHQDYELVTPFDETAGPYAGSAYDAFQLLWQALDVAAENNDTIDKTAVSWALEGLTIEGLTGTVYQP